MYLIAGLGNPGTKYNMTRHNIGFDVLDRYASLNNIQSTKKKFKSIFFKGKINNEDVVLLKPLTYMNLSGEAVKKVADYYDIEDKDIIIIYDDVNLRVGDLKIKTKGSSGGHNGIKNIIENIGSKNFIRIKFGVGPKPEYFDMADFVLSKFEKEKIEDVKKGINQAVEALDLILKGKVEESMNKFNSKGV